MNHLNPQYHNETRVEAAAKYEESQKNNDKLNQEKNELKIQIDEVKVLLNEKEAAIKDEVVMNEYYIYGGGGKICFLQNILVTFSWPS